MVISQAEIWWADLGEPVGSAPGYRRAVVVIQCDAINRSLIGTIVCVPLTSNLRWSAAPGNARLGASATGLPQDSVANVSQVTTLAKQQLIERIGKIPRRQLELILSGIDVILGR